MMAPPAVWDCLMPLGLSRLAGAAGGGAERSRVLDEVEKPVTARSVTGGLADPATSCWHICGDGTQGGG